MSQAAGVDPPGGLRAQLEGRVERCWAWLDQWGHQVEPVDLSGVPLMDLLDLAGAAEERVRVLAAHWEHWW